MKHLEKPKVIDFGDKRMPTNEIAAVHQQAYRDCSYYVILNNYWHNGESYQIGKEHQTYADVQALYDYLHYVWVEEDAEEIRFYAYDSAALGILYEVLERDRYAFLPRCLGSDVINEIAVYRNQGDDLDALDREGELPSLIENFRTDTKEDEGDHIS